MSKSSPLDDPKSFASALVRWFEKGGKDYPWRRTRDPYAILVSELMLQQTQIATVLSRRYFENWLEKFPTPAALAEAQEADILKAWEGLGYYRRARNLQKAATAIVQQHGGEFPRDPAEILALPGVGPYTAGAVSSFAFGDSQPIVDGNIARVLSRLFDFHQEIDSTPGQRQLWQWAEQLVPEKKARDYNSGLMELGQTLCSVSEPDCKNCPVNKFCLTQHPTELPKRKPRTKTTKVDEHVRYVLEKGKILLEQEAAGGRREGLWKLPELPEEKIGIAEKLHEMKYSITRYRVTLSVYADRQGTKRLEQGQAWHTLAETQNLAMPSPYRKCLDALQS